MQARATRSAMGERDPPEAPRLVHYSWIVALSAAAALFCGLGLGRFAFGMLLPSMSASLDLDYGQGGLLGFLSGSLAK